MARRLPRRPRAATRNRRCAGSCTGVGHAVPTMTTAAPPLLDDPADLSALRAIGADPDELFADFAAWAEAERHGAVPGAGGGADRAGQRRERRPGDADRLGQVAGRHRRAVRGTGRRTAQLLHRADQGAGQREVLRALRGLRRGQRRHADRRRRGQPRRADHRLHRRGPGQHRAARGRRTPTSASWSWTSSTSTATPTAAGPGRCRCWSCRRRSSC